MKIEAYIDASLRRPLDECDGEGGGAHCGRDQVSELSLSAGGRRDGNHFHRRQAHGLREDVPLIPGVKMARYVVRGRHLEECEDLFVRGARRVIDSEPDAHGPGSDRLVSQLLHALDLFRRGGLISVGRSGRPPEGRVSHGCGIVHEWPRGQHPFLIRCHVKRTSMHAEGGRYTVADFLDVRLLCRADARQNVDEPRRDNEAPGVDFVAASNPLDRNRGDLPCPDTHIGDLVASGLWVHHASIQDDGFVNLLGA